MTLKELSQLYYLNREIESDKRRLTELRAKAYSMSGASSGNTQGSFDGSRLERCATEIVDLEAAISEKISRCTQERIRLESYISDIPDSLTRQIFTYRFVDGYTWRKVAMCVGGSNTEDAVKKICYRYISSTI